MALMPVRGAAAVVALVLAVAGCTGEADADASAATPSVTATDDTLAAPDSRGAGGDGGATGESDDAGGDAGNDAEDDAAGRQDDTADAVVPTAHERAAYDLATSFVPAVEGLAWLDELPVDVRRVNDGGAPADVNPAECAALALAGSLGVAEDASGGDGADDIVVTLGPLTEPGAEDDPTARAVTVAVRIMDSESAAAGVPTVLLGTTGCEDYVIEREGSAVAVAGASVRLVDAVGMAAPVVRLAVEQESAQHDGDDEPLVWDGTTAYLASQGRFVMRIGVSGYDADEADAVAGAMLAALGRHLRDG